MTKPLLLAVCLFVSGPALWGAPLPELQPVLGKRVNRSSDVILQPF